MVWSSVISCTTRMQPSKSVSSESTRAPFASGCTSCAVEILRCAAGAWHGRGLVCYASSGKESSASWTR